MTRFAVPVVAACALLAAIGCIAAAAPKPRLAAADSMSVSVPTEVIVDDGFTYIAATEHGHLRMRHAAGDELLDYADPARPTVRQAGEYVFQATVECWCDHQPGAATVVFGIGPDVGGFSVDQVFSLDAGRSTPRASGSVQWHADAGDPVGLVVFNDAAVTLPYDPIVAALKRVG